MNCLIMAGCAHPTLAADGTFPLCVRVLNSYHPPKALKWVGTHPWEPWAPVLADRPRAREVTAVSRFVPQHLARYVEQYVGTEGAASSPTEGFLLKPVFLQR